MIRVDLSNRVELSGGDRDNVRDIMVISVFILAAKIIRLLQRDTIIV